MGQYIQSFLSQIRTRYPHHSLPKMGPRTLDDFHQARSNPPVCDFHISKP